MKENKKTFAAMVAEAYKPGATRFLMGLDLGQASDYSAFSIVEEKRGEDAAEYHVRHLERWPLRTSYTQIAADVAMMAGAPELKGGGRNLLAVDMNGPGAPFVDVLRTHKPGAEIVPVFSHGGDKVIESEGVWRVPKRVLVSRAKIALETGRLKVAPALAHAATLRRELENYQVEINEQTAHDSYGAWRTGTHDDLLFAVMLPVWCAGGVRLPFGVLATGKVKVKGRAVASDVFDRGTRYRKTIIR